MKKLVLSLLLAFSWLPDLFSQGAPACPSITASGGSICTGSCLNLSANVVTNNQTTSYSVTSIAYNPYPCNGTGTQISVATDDVWSPTVNLPFTFCYFGTSYNTCLIGSNGQITFDQTTATPNGYDNWSITSPMPNTTDMPPNTICGVFRDIDPSLGGSVYYNIVGNAPCRALVVCFDNVPLFDNTGVGATTCGGTPNSTFQMVLYENTNYIDIYVNNSFSCSGWNGGYGEIGIQDGTGTVAVVAPGWNNPSTPTGNNVAFRFTPSGPPSYTVTWSDASGVVGTGLTLNVCPGATTTYTASMTLTNCNGSQLTVTDTALVTVVPGQGISVNSPTICAGSSTVLTATGGTSYSWSANAGSATTSTVSVSPNTTTVYTVTANGGGGGNCAPVAMATVTVVPSLSVTVNSPPVICAGGSATLTASGAANYTWSPGTGLSSTSSGTVTASPNTTTTYTVTGSSGSCPTASAVTTVSVTPSGTITINSATICPTSNATLTASGGSSYNWNPSTGLSTTSGPTVVASPPSTTVYTVSGGSCDLPGTCTVTVIPACNITVNSAVICPGQSATLTANGGGPYTWAPGTGLSSTSGASVVANPSSTTVYTVTSVSGGFTTTATSTVTVNQVPTISATNTIICQGSVTTLVVSGASTYTWTPATGLSATTASTVAASPSVTTTYTITGMASNTCTNTTVATVGVMPMPNVLVTPSDTQGCAPVCVNFSGSSSTSTQNCAWNFGDGSSSVLCASTHCFNAQGTFNVSLTITDANGCTGTGTSTVSVHPMPKADFTADPQPTTILDPKVQFYDQTTQAPVTSWHWNFGAWGLADTSRLKNPSYTYKDTGSYLVTLLVSTAYGCKDSTEKWIRIEDDYELFVPTAFSPNNDGLNETFLPIASGVKESGYNLYIYDRWGNLVFHSTDLSIGWDGTIKNEVVLEDIYVWKILLKTTTGVAKQAHGIVNVVK